MDDPSENYDNEPIEEADDPEKKLTISKLTQMMRMIYQNLLMIRTKN
jgi:hypothetical protein